LIQDLKLSEFDWAFSPSKENAKPRRSESDVRKGRELVEEFLYWYFDSFLIPLLKVSQFTLSTRNDLVNLFQTTFYCTESSAFKNQVLFFRQDDWEVLCKPLLDKLFSETFEPLSQVLYFTVL
jgi:telomerase reverse transcriptase